VSKESVLIGFFILTLMVTFLLTFRLTEGSAAARVNWWTHMLVILLFLGLIPNSKHLHLLLSPITVFLKSPILQTVPNLDFEKEQVGLETVKDLPKKAVLDALTCVECGRCQDNCPATATGKLLNPKQLILQNEAALLAVSETRSWWTSTTRACCGSARRAAPASSRAPVGVEHTPVIIGARRGLVSNGEAPEFLTPMFTNLERRQNIWGLMYEQRTKFVQAATFETFDPPNTSTCSGSAAPGRSKRTSRRAIRSLADLLRHTGKTFGVLSKERCTGDPAKRTGNEYMFQELAGQNIEDLKAAGVKKIVASCPHCVKTIGHDYRMMGYEVEIVHSASSSSS
jgi:Fe-S oxidoreductase